MWITEFAQKECVVIIACMNELNQNPNDAVVTVGILKSILQDALQPIHQEIKQEADRTATSFGLVMAELSAVQQSVATMEKTVSTFNHGLIGVENGLKKLDARVLKLELVK